MAHHPRTCTITRAHAPPPARRARLVGRAGHLPPSPSISLHLPPPPSLRPRLTTGGSSYGYVARALSVAPLRRQRVLSRWAELEQRGTPFALEADCPTLRTRVRWQVANEVRGRAPGLAPGGPACVLRGSSGPGGPGAFDCALPGLWAQLARTAACAARWLHGIHPAGAFGTQEPCLMHAWRSDWNVSRLPCFDAARFAPAVLRHLTDPLHETSQCFR